MLLYADPGIMNFGPKFTYIGGNNILQAKGNPDNRVWGSDSPFCYLHFCQINIETCDHEVFSSHMTFYGW